jgi:hypothetical protein
MKINMNVKHKFKINGKEYNSIEEMPADIREAFRKAMGSQATSGQGINHTTARTKIIFNGTEYESIDAMPPDVRDYYEEVMKAAEAGAAPHIDITGTVSVSPIKHQAQGTTPSGDRRKQITAEPSFSRRALILSIVAVALIVLFYYLMRGR